jgi:hypothetical protein
MIISNDRSEFDLAFSDKANIFMLLFGKETLPQQIHDLALKAAPEGWRKTVLITNIGILSEKEKTEWFKDTSKYVTLSKSRTIVELDSLEKLCSKSGKPSARLIQIAFGKADQ